MEDTDDFLSLSCYDISNQTETTIHVPVSEDGTRISRASNAIQSREIFLPDTRYTVDPTISPYQAIVQVVTNFSSGSQKKGTGFMISENVVLTAAHCITSVNGYSVSNITVYGGRSSSSYVASSTVAQFIRDQQYEGPAANEYDWDYAILILNEPIGETLGWFGLQSSTATALPTYTITTAGFPLEPKEIEDEYPTMYASSGSISAVSNYTFIHDADTERGQSGSPIFHYYNSTYGNVVVGIHVASGNTGRRITSTLCDFLFEQGYIHE